MNYVATGYSVKPAQWDEKASKVKPQHPNAIRLNSALNALMNNAWDKILEAERENPGITSRQLRYVVMHEPTNDTDFYEYAEQYRSQFNNIKQAATYEVYRQVIKRLKEYRPRLFMPDITVAFLRNYDGYLKKKGLSTNTIFKHLKTIRTIIYAAIKDHKVDQSANPFFEYKLKWEPAKKQYLAPEELENLRTMELEERSLLWYARAMWLFQFNCMGMRVSDALALCKKDRHADMLNYRMAKTGTILTMKLTKEAQLIWSRCERKESKYIFPFLDTFKDIGTATAFVNKQLKKLADKLELTKPLSSHIARHTWSNMAWKTTKDIRLVQKGLRHGRIATTENYLATLADSDMDEANERITQGF